MIFNLHIGSAGRGIGMGGWKTIGVAVSVAVLAFGPQAVIAEEFNNEIQTWTKKGMLAGAISTENDCVRSDRLWISYKGSGYCIRYFKNEHQVSDGSAIIFFGGDYVGSDWDSNGRPIRPKYVVNHDGKELFREILNLPKAVNDFSLFFLSRPGQLGSSGDHKDKYKRHESRVMNTAIDQIKNRYNIRQVVLAGQSGGATLVANILAMRSDVKCAVMTSGAIALHSYAQDSGFHPAVWALWQDPMLSVEKIAPSSAEYFVIAGQGDTVRPPKYQKMFADALTARGLSAHYLVLRKRGNAHDLTREALQVADACAKGRPLAQIRRQLKMPNSQ